MSTSPRFRIGHFPQKVDNGSLRLDLQWIKDVGVASGGLTEMALRKDDVMAVFGPDEDKYRVHFEEHGGRPIEIPGFVNKKLANEIDFQYIAISPGIANVSFVKPRGITLMKYILKVTDKHGKTEKQKVAHIHTHWDAALQNKDTGGVYTNAKRVAFARDNSRRIEALARRLMEHGWAVFITGDFNYRNFKWLARFRLWYYSPQRMFKRLKLHYEEQGLDYMAYDTKRVRRVGMETVPPGHRGNHGDHPYLIGSFAWV